MESLANDELRRYSNGVLGRSVIYEDHSFNFEGERIATLALWLPVWSDPQAGRLLEIKMKIRCQISEPSYFPYLRLWVMMWCILQPGYFRGQAQPRKHKSGDKNWPTGSMRLKCGDHPRRQHPKSSVKLRSAHRPRVGSFDVAARQRNGAVRRVGDSRAIPVYIFDWHFHPFEKCPEKKTKRLWKNEDP